MTARLSFISFRSMETIGEFHKQRVVIGLRVLKGGQGMVNLASGEDSRERAVVWESNRGSGPFVKGMIDAPIGYECISGTAWSIIASSGWETSGMKSVWVLDVGSVTGIHNQTTNRSFAWWVPMWGWSCSHRNRLPWRSRWKLPWRTRWKLLCLTGLRWSF